MFAHRLQFLCVCVYAQAYFIHLDRMDNLMSYGIPVAKDMRRTN